MKGNALKVYVELDNATRQDWASTQEALASRFKTTKEPQLFKSQFLIRKWKPGETLLEFGQSVRTLSRNAYPDLSSAMRDELARDQFIRGIENTEMVLRLRHNLPKTLDDAIRMAIDWQAIENDVRGVPSNMVAATLKVDSTCGNSDSVAVASASGSDLPSMMKEMLDLLKEDRESRQRDRNRSDSQYRPRGRNSRGRGSFQARDRDRTTDMKDIKCYGCGRLGHFERNCPKDKECWHCHRLGHYQFECPLKLQSENAE